jgi:hypothetical protein
LACFRVNIRQKEKRGIKAPLSLFSPLLKSLSVSLYERETLNSPFAKGGLRGIQWPWQLQEGDKGGEVEISLLKADYLLC